MIRNFLIKRDGYKCRCCGIDSWNGKDITLWTDHIDGNATNNHHSNFRLVCPNCDSQSDTFGAKNYSKGRKSLGLPQYG
jgi:Zn finger protein HypA/HybF involved in hydrogenase expression